MPDDQSINERGNVVTRTFNASADRYLFDLDKCSQENGWLQFDTDQDAWYFGVWVHPKNREVMTYAEGDVIHVKCPDAASYRTEIEDLIAFYGQAPYMTTISENGEVVRYYQDRPGFLIEEPDVK